MSGSRKNFPLATFFPNPYKKGSTMPERFPAKPGCMFLSANFLRKRTRGPVRRKCLLLCKPSPLALVENTSLSLSLSLYLLLSLLQSIRIEHTLIALAIYKEWLTITTLRWVIIPTQRNKPSISSSPAVDLPILTLPLAKTPPQIGSFLA